MTISNAEACRRYRERKRGGPAKQLKPCGTYAAAVRHQRAGEPLDAACSDALDEYRREQNKRWHDARRTTPES